MFNEICICKFVVRLNNKDEIESLKRWEEDFEGRLEIGKEVINTKCYLCADFIIISYKYADYERIIEEDRKIAESLRKQGK
jgi:hypothetical protein